MAACWWSRSLLYGYTQKRLCSFVHWCVTHSVTNLHDCCVKRRRLEPCSCYKRFQKFARWVKPMPNHICFDFGSICFCDVLLVWRRILLPACGVAAATIVARRSAIADCTARRVWKVKRASFLLRVGAFKPKFYGSRVIPYLNVDTVQ